MKKIFLCLVLAGCISGTKTPEAQATSSGDWEVLFDGESLNGWHRFNHKGIPPIWTAKDGILTFDPALRPEGDYIHDLISDKEFTSFQLSIEWNIAEGGNSGVFWAVQEAEGLHKPYSTGPEIQVLDNERHPDAKANPKFHQAGALYDLVQPTQDVCKPAGSWNHFLITIDHNKNEGSVALNGVTIVEFPVHGSQWDEMIANSKFADPCDFRHFAKVRKGRIGLQDHGDKVSFRNIKIKEL